jgi:hypothetical protein
MLISLAQARACLRANANALMSDIMKKGRWQIGLLLAGWLGGVVASGMAEDGWRPLFDGHSFQGWRLLRESGPPKQGWKIEDGILKKMGGQRGGNLVTVETFEEFELEWEWRLPARANNGIKYFVLEERGGAIGHEYQMIDDSVVGGAKHRTGSFYDVLPPRPDGKPPRIGDWNRSRVKVQGQRVEHWLNGELILEYELGSPEVLEAVSRSKFRNVDRFGTRLRGHILLTDHNDEAWFRNIRVRD